MCKPPNILKNHRLDLFTTLKAGGVAEQFKVCYSRQELSDLAIWAQLNKVPTTYLGGGSNVLPSDNGVNGLVVVNKSARVKVLDNNLIEADSGTPFQDLFLRATQSGLSGLEFAVGIPGSVGGALVSNAGAYRNNISTFLTEIEVVRNGIREWLTPEFMEFSYRDSVLRKPNPPEIALLAVRFSLPTRVPEEIFRDARDYQQQRIGKQPPSASAGSFFKNVVNMELAQSIPGLTDGMRSAGVIPAGFLIEQCGLKGKRHGGAMIGSRHANFLLNVGGATATEIRRLAEFAQAQVKRKFGVSLEEEALYLGDWASWTVTGEL